MQYSPFLIAIHVEKTICLNRKFFRVTGLKIPTPLSISGYFSQLKRRSKSLYKKTIHHFNTTITQSFRTQFRKFYIASERPLFWASDIMRQKKATAKICEVSRIWIGPNSRLLPRWNVIMASVERWLHYPTSNTQESRI